MTALNIQPGDLWRTRDGRAAKITEVEKGCHLSYPVIGYVDGKIRSWTPWGSLFITEIEPLDLIEKIDPAASLDALADAAARRAVTAPRGERLNRMRVARLLRLAALTTDPAKRREILQPVLESM